MEETKPSGKTTLIQGALRFLWEELKTLNRMKFRSLARMGRGYWKMKNRSG
jgi:hypothetical protein